MQYQPAGAAAVAHLHPAHAHLAHAYVHFPLPLHLTPVLFHHHHHHQPPMNHHHHHPHAAAAAGGAHHHHHATHAGVGVSTAEFLSNLAVQSPLDVYDIHETGWRRAILLAKRDRHEFLVRYIGWDTKWDEWIRGSSNRLAPSNSKTAALANTGFKGPKSADEIASQELGRDWNAARQEGVMCDVLFVLHTGHTNRGLRGGTPMHASPLRTRSTGRKDEQEGKSNASQASAPSTPATSPMVRGLSGLGILSPRLASLSATTSPNISSSPPPPLYFSAHSHIINMRCPDLLKTATISLPPVANFEEPGSSPTVPNTPLRRGMSHPNEERKDDSGGRSLADQEAATAAGTAPSLLNYSLESDIEPTPSLSPEQLSSSPAVLSQIEEKATSLDEDDEMPMAVAGSLSRSGSITGASGVGGFSELHPGVTQYDISCVPNATIMQNLLTYIYTGDLAQHFLPSIRHVFELATVAHLLHLDRLLDLSALALNRMITQENFLLALKLGLHFQSKVLGNLETICTLLQEAQLAASQSIANEVHSHVSNAKIHSQLSPLLRVCFEYIMLHWELCWSSFDNLVAFQQLPPAIFQLIMRFMPLKNITAAPFTVIYPTIHPSACNLTNHFKRLYADRTDENTDFRIIVTTETEGIGGGEEHVIYAHKAVLACRSEYFRALFRCSFAEGKDSCVRLDATQHNPASMEALVKYLYSADLKVNPTCGVYLSNCTDFFGLSSNTLEQACQELVSQHHCLKVLKSAWQSRNEGLFKRACKFIDWSTLAKLMNGQKTDDPDAMDLADGTSGQDEEEIEGEEEDAAGVAVGFDGDVVEVDIEAEEAAAIAADAAGTSTTNSPATSPLLAPTRSRSTPASPLIDPSDVEMWKAIVQEKSLAQSREETGTRKRPR